MKLNELTVDTFSCEKHSVRNSLNLFNITIPSPITVSAMPEDIIILKNDSHLSRTNWIKTRPVLPLALAFGLVLGLAL